MQPNAAYHQIDRISVVDHRNSDLHWIHMMLSIICLSPFNINQKLIGCLDFDETGFSSLPFLKVSLTIINF